MIHIASMLSAWIIHNSIPFVTYPIAGMVF